MGSIACYELGKDFRNEGISPKHNPEFTMLEWYEAYADYMDEAERLEQLVASVAESAFGGTKVEREADEIDLSPPWQRITLRDAVKERTGLDLAERPSREELAAALGREPEPEEGWGKLVDGVLSKLVEPTLIQPTFILDYPVELSPFAKRHRSDEGFVERWEAFVGGVEIANAFTELNDPDEQRRRFEQQAEELRRGDEDAQPFDEAFVEALEQGMPPDRRCRPGDRPAGDDPGGRARTCARSCCSLRCGTRAAALVNSAGLGWVGQRPASPGSTRSASDASEAPVALTDRHM